MDSAPATGVIGLNLGSTRLSRTGLRMVHWRRSIVATSASKESRGRDEVEYRGRVLCEIGAGSPL
jgi:hypothetical protein